MNVYLLLWWDRWQEYDIEGIFSSLDSVKHFLTQRHGAPGGWSEWVDDGNEQAAVNPADECLYRCTRHEIQA